MSYPLFSFIEHFEMIFINLKRTVENPVIGKQIF
jgi:hypothetical protein